MKKRIFILIPFLLLSGCKGKRISFEEAKNISNEIRSLGTRNLVVSQSDFKITQESKQTTTTSEKITKTIEKLHYEVSYNNKWFYLYNERTVDDSTDINEDWFFIKNGIFFHSSSRQVDGKVISKETYDLSNISSNFEDINESFDYYVFISRKFDILIGNTTLGFKNFLELGLPVAGYYSPEYENQKYYSSGFGNLTAKVNVHVKGVESYPDLTFDFKANYVFEDFHLKKQKIKSKSNGYVNNITGEYVDRKTDYSQITSISNKVKVSYPDF